MSITTWMARQTGREIVGAAVPQRSSRFAPSAEADRRTQRSPLAAYESCGSDRGGVMNLPDSLDLAVLYREVLRHPHRAELLHLHVVKQHRLVCVAKLGEQLDPLHQR